MKKKTTIKVLPTENGTNNVYVINLDVRTCHVRCD